MSVTTVNAPDSAMSSVGPPREFLSNTPVILFGHGRSGTSIIAAQMRDHLGVAFGTESQFILQYNDRIGAYQPLDQDQNLRRLIDDLLQERWFRRSRKFRDFQLTGEQVFDAVEERTYRGVLNAIFGLFAGHLGMSRWGDKTPAYIHRMEVIDELFPDAKYVYVVRDGRDVAMSLKRIHFGPKNMYTAAVDWSETILDGDRFADQLSPERLHTIRYEDFLADPVETFYGLGQFLGVVDPEGALRSELERSLAPKVKQNNSDKWRQELSERQLLAFERIAFNELSKHGYETFGTGAGRPLGTLERMYWHALSRSARWMFWDHWKDNFYKANLRLRRLISR